ncbi:MAG: hypothetical protein ABR902_04200 [Candidatus Korobacteraceae bacterium]
MEFGTGRLEASTRIEERCSGQSGEEQKRRAPRQRHHDPLADDEALTEEQTEGHQLDDMA